MSSPSNTVVRARACQQWAVDEVYDRAMLGVHIPDTIIVQKGRPAHWFHTDPQTMRAGA